MSIPMIGHTPCRPSTLKGGGGGGGGDCVVVGEESFVACSIWTLVFYNN